jgi:hypothetical protein
MEQLPMFNLSSSKDAVATTSTEKGHSVPSSVFNIVANNYADAKPKPNNVELFEYMAEKWMCVGASGFGLRTVGPE